MPLLEEVVVVVTPPSSIVRHDSNDQLQTNPEVVEDEKTEQQHRYYLQSNTCQEGGEEDDCLSSDKSSCLTLSSHCGNGGVAGSSSCCAESVVSTRTETTHVDSIFGRYLYSSSHSSYEIDNSHTDTFTETETAAEYYHIELDRTRGGGERSSSSEPMTGNNKGKNSSNKASPGLIVAVEEDSLSSTEGEGQAKQVSVNKMVEAAAAVAAASPTPSSPSTSSFCGESKPLREKVPSSLDIIVATEEDSDEQRLEGEVDDDSSLESDSSQHGSNTLKRSTVHGSFVSLATAGAVMPDDDTIVRGSACSSRCPSVGEPGESSASGGGTGEPAGGNSGGEDPTLMSIRVSTTELRSVPSSSERPMPRRSSMKSESSYGTPDLASPVNYNRRGSVKVLPKPDVPKLQQEQMQRTISMKAFQSMPDLHEPNAGTFQRRHTVGFDEGSCNRVTFDRIIIREHRRTMGDNPSCSYGTPVSLDWEYIQHEDLTLEQYEQLKVNSRIRSGGKPRTLRQLHLNHYQRRNILQMEGYTLQQIKAQKRETNKVRKQRDMTRFMAQTPVLIKIEDIVESSKRKLFGRKNSVGVSASKNPSKAKQQQPTVIPPAPHQAPITLKKPSGFTSLKADELNDSNGTQATVATAMSSS
eukprot:CAMPEP_0113506978 /NCGR_PEP_ID=MMETSP0014_2-20120614/36207_1 /TAXON_ID=2857 /ORGANISM="Nitzschia sp." /LENGTH=638 /DNA_ID=CAMNT_0000402531 /DNA_START=412 /DNA_END=2328 /DNA_ORIENTATION=+ /assembly_acc=CAM_ASM_000159